MPKQILIVDDEREICNFLRELLDLSFSDFVSVDVASNGERGLELALQKKYDCIITDLFMPKMNGVEFINKLRSTRDNYLCPILVISGNPVDSLIKDFSYISMLSKPFNKNDFLKVIINQLKIRSELDAVSQVIFDLVYNEITHRASLATNLSPSQEELCSKSKAAINNELCFQLRITYNKTTSKLLIGINHKLLKKIKKRTLKKSFRSVKKELAKIYGSKNIIVNDIKLFRRKKAVALLRDSLGAIKKLSFNDQHIHIISTAGVTSKDQKLVA